MDTVRMTVHKMQIAVKAYASVLTDIEAIGCTTAKYLLHKYNLLSELLLKSAHNQGI